MSNPEHIARLLEGKAAWETWAQGEAHAGRGLFDFSGVEFERADFKGYTFAGSVNFSGCTFKGDADFHAANFQGRPNFHGVRFLGNAGFAGCDFQSGAGFTRGRFQGDAWFTNADFYGQVWFEEATFHGDFEADGGMFHQNARFSAAVFSGRAWFYDATFVRGAWFNRARFDGDARFTRAKFEGAAEEFSDASFRIAPDFRGARYVVPPTLQRAVVGYATDKAGTAWQRLLGRAIDNSQAPSYRRLKQLASEAKDHEREQEFFALEMRAKRFYETTGFWPLALNIGYDWLSGYGRSVVRPLAWWVALIIASLVIVLLLVPASGNTGMVDRWGAALVIAVTNSALLIGSDKWLPRMEAVERLCSSCQGKLGLAADSLFYAQSGLSLLLVFLIGLALRNRFRIGGSS